MKPKRIWANLTVEDLERTTKFYTELGFKSNGASKELTSFLFGQNDFVIHFFLKVGCLNKLNSRGNGLFPAIE